MPLCDVTEELELVASAADTEHVNRSGFEDLLCEFCARVCFLTGLSESCLDELALEHLFPLPLLHNYVRLVHTHTHTHTHTHSCKHTQRTARD